MDSKAENEMTENKRNMLDKTNKLYIRRHKVTQQIEKTKLKTKKRILLMQLTDIDDELDSLEGFLR